MFALGGTRHNHDGAADGLSSAHQCDVTSMHPVAQRNQHNGCSGLFEGRAHLRNHIELGYYRCLPATNAHRSSSCNPHISNSILCSNSPTRRAALTKAFLNPGSVIDRKSTRLNSSHVATSYAVSC